MYTGLYLISRSRIVAYLDDIVKFGDYRQIWRWYLPKLAVDLEYVISLAIAGSPANSQSKPLIFTAYSVHLALTKLVCSDSQTFWAWSKERTYETGEHFATKRCVSLLYFRRKMPVIPLLGALFGNELSSNLTISGKRRYSNQLMNIHLYKGKYHCLTFIIIK